MAWKELFAKGISHFQASQFEESISCFTKAIALQDDQYILYDSRAAAYEATGRYSNALQDAKKVINLAHTRWQGYARSARLFLKACKWDAALLMVEHALERIKPQDSKRRVELVSLREEVMVARKQASEEDRLATARSVCHFKALPVELITEIFRAVVQSDVAALIVLLRVCRHWRGIVESTSVLWNTLVLTDKSLVSKARRWITHARGKIRELRARSAGNDETSLAYEHLRGLYWPHLRVLTLEDQHILFLSRVTRHTPFLNAVTEINLTSRDGLIWDLEPFLRAVPNLCLRALRLDGVSFTPALLAAHCTSLRILTVLRLPRGISDPSVLIAANPLIEHLTLDCLTFGAPQSLPLPLTHLTHLELVGPYISTFFTTAFTPLLHTLSLRRCPSDIDTVLAYLSTSESRPASLTSLTIDRCTFTAPVFIRLLHVTPSLETLEIIHVARCVNAVAEALANPDENSGPEPNFLCPRLTYIDFSHSDVTTGPLVRLVNGRFNASAAADTSPSSASVTLVPATPASLSDSVITPLTAPVHALATLLIDDCSLIDAAWIPELRGKVPHFSCVYMTKRAARWRR